MNLALNARDAMRGGGRLPSRPWMSICRKATPNAMSASISLAGPYVMLVVSDTGQGMTPEVKARLFEPFFTTKPTTQNTGLGLATVYGIVVQSGGLHLGRQRTGKGNRVQDLLSPGGAGRQGTPRRSSPGAHEGLRDDPAGRRRETVRTVAARVLLNQGYAVHEASNGEEALALAEKLDGAVDLVLTDVVMPDMGGPSWPGAWSTDGPG